MTIRNTYIVAFLVITFLLATGFYLQYVDGFIPCPLCILQRFSFALLWLFFLIGAVLYSKRWLRMSVDVLCVIVSIAGIVFAGRQIYLQKFPSPDGGECGVSIQYMMQVLPITEVLQKIFAGSAECTQRGWEFLYLTMAEWTLLWFIAFLILSLCITVEEFFIKSH